MLSVEEFNNISKQYALNHVSDTKYKWMITKQVSDFNFDSYLKLEYSNLILTLKSVHPDYILRSCLINDCIYFNEDKKMSTVYKLNKFVECITIYAEIEPIDKYSGLLNIELSTNIYSRLHNSKMF